MTTPQQAGSRLARIARVNVGIALAVTALKGVACLFSDSVALYSDAIEGAVNVASAVAVLVAVEFSRHPPDQGHPYGHEKAEYLAAGFEGGLIMLAALTIFTQAARALVTPSDLAGLGTAAAINGVATLINAAWGSFLVIEGRRSRSAALTADGLHVLTDVATSVGVLAGLLLVWMTGFTWIDPSIAIVVAVYILWSGYSVLQGSFGGLLDEAVDPEVQSRIRRAIKAEGIGAIQAHRLRTRRAGRTTFIEFHLVVPGSMTVDTAHAICDRIERAVEADVPGAEVSIHVEPAEEACDDHVVEI